MKKIALIVSGLANGGVESFIKNFYSNENFKEYNMNLKKLQNFILEFHLNQTIQQIL